MAKFEGEQVLMRIFISESDRYQNRPLSEVILELCLKRGIAGATVLKGAAGFGSHGRLHTDRLLRLAEELPLIIEVVDSQASIDQLVPELDTMLVSGMITLEKAHVIRYLPAKPEG